MGKEGTGPGGGNVGVCEHEWYEVAITNGESEMCSDLENRCRRLAPNYMSPGPTPKNRVCLKCEHVNLAFDEMIDALRRTIDRYTEARGRAQDLIDRERQRRRILRDG